jgi:hypothetical protein
LSGRGAEEIGLLPKFEVREGRSASEIVEIIANYDLFVMSRGGLSLLDRVVMFIKRLPLSGLEIEALMYAPKPTILVGEIAGVKNG